MQGMKLFLLDNEHCLATVFAGELKILEEWEAGPDWEPKAALLSFSDQPLGKHCLDVGNECLLVLLLGADIEAPLQNRPSSLQNRLPSIQPPGENPALVGVSSVCEQKKEVTKEHQWRWCSI